MTAPEPAARIRGAEKPILFSASMIRAEREGRKTQTRRALNPQPDTTKLSSPWRPEQRGRYGWGFMQRIDFPEYQYFGGDFTVRWAPGDRLWVREAYYQQGHWEPIQGQMTRKGNRQKWQFVADSEDIVFDPPENYRSGMLKAYPWTSAWHRRLARFMPHRYSRTMLEVTAVKIERLQDISEADAIAEGIETTEFWREEHPPSICYSVLWDHINGAGSWESNPFVTATTFRRVTV